MTKYRIKRHKGFDWVTYEVQKKVWFIPFWYNFNNIDACTTGFYASKERAIKAIEENKYKKRVTFLHIE